MKTRSFSERLEDKSAQSLLTNHFRERYNYNPAMAEAIFQDTVFVRTLLDPTAREDGQIIRYFPKATEPAGKPLRDCEYVAVRLTLYAAGDAEFLAEHGPKALRQHKLKRICDEALAQRAPASQEDLAALLGCHRSTIIRESSGQEGDHPRRCHRPRTRHQSQTTHPQDVPVRPPALRGCQANRSYPGEC